jgi:peptide/nickel transport system ATP-binding protein
MLELDHVTKRYHVGTFGSGEMVAVRDVSFTIAPGEIVSLIGESGSGKSTIGRMILRLTRVTSGAIRFEGNDVAPLEGRRLKEYYRHVQGVFQDPFSSYNPIFKADRTFALVRNAYARALLLEIRFLVADEVISMLDASTRVDVLNLLSDLKDRGLGILFITHDLSLGNYVSERTMILRRGRVVELGPTEKVFGDPRHPYTQSLLASVPQLHRKWSESDVPNVPPADDGTAELVEVSDGHLVALS